MSGIEIKKIGITRVAADAIVNAANDGLWAGGGVCGVIFEDAGYDELTEACDKIGGCKTGSAVITPGFKLPAKYIIHAVGPVWCGGDNNEPQLLYSAYEKSLMLAKENDCRSIAFPLISAGIFGYPVNQAWRKALQSNISMNPSEKLDGTIEDSKYYPKGLRESGKDNKEAVVNNQGTGLSAFGDVNTGFYAPTVKTIYVDRDVDYVVSYALKGGDV